MVGVALVIVWAITGPFFRYSDTRQRVIDTSKDPIRHAIAVPP
ncbi:low affinity iron permease family protein [Pararobbsia alpina]